MKYTILAFIFIAYMFCVALGVTERYDYAFTSAVAMFASFCFGYLSRKS